MQNGESTDEAAFNEVLVNALGGIEQSTLTTEQMTPEVSYKPDARLNTIKTSQF